MILIVINVGESLPYQTKYVFNTTAVLEYKIKINKVLAAAPTAYC